VASFSWLVLTDPVGCGTALSTIEEEDCSCSCSPYTAILINAACISFENVSTRCKIGETLCGEGVK